MSESNSGRTIKLLKDIGIYAIGNLGSKLVTFMLVPLYTHYIKPDAYGYYDICLTAVFILMPFLSLQLRDGGFRFLIEAKDGERKRAIITFVYKTLFLNSLITITLGIISAFFLSLEYLGLLIALLIAMSIYEVVIQVIRGLGYTKHFVASGIISAFLIGIFSLIFVVWLDMQIEGIFLANILARLLTILILEIRLKILLRYFRYRFNDKAVNKEIIKYCLPLLPGTICWWLVGSSNKFFIEHYLGLDQNGLYAVALKFTAILETIAFIFYQAWQETAIRQYDSKDRDRYFSKIFNNYLYILGTLVILFPFVLKLNYFWLVDSAYNSSAQYLFPLSISAMIYSLAAFFDMGYQCSKRTIYTLPGIALAAIVNIIANYFLIQEFQTFGIIASSIITFLTLLIYRLIDTRRFFKIGITHRSFVIITLIIISGTIFYLISSTTIIILYIVFLLAIIGYLAPQEIKNAILNKANLKKT
ncbi:MAG: oligosaccharide flippase family protein [Muribaculaceae bacterium]|nr:oligosaccharide flippase family protein [Muribaculaceae bacterium]